MALETIVQQAFAIIEAHEAAKAAELQALFIDHLAPEPPGVVTRQMQNVIQVNEGLDAMRDVAYKATWAIAADIPCDEDFELNLGSD